MLVSVKLFPRLSLDVIQHCLVDRFRPAMLLLPMGRLCGPGPHGSQRTLAGSSNRQASVRKGIFCAACSKMRACVLRDTIEKISPIMAFRLHNAGPEGELAACSGDVEYDSCVGQTRTTRTACQSQENPNGHHLVTLAAPPAPTLFLSSLVKQAPPCLKAPTRSSTLL